MQNDPGHDGENSKQEAAKAGEPIADVQVRQGKPDNTAEIIGGAIGGIIGIIGGVLLTAGHSKSSLWVYFVAICVGIGSLVSFLSEHNHLPPRIGGSPRKLLVVVLVPFLVLFLFLDYSIRSNERQATHEKVIAKKQFDGLKNDLGETRRRVAEQQRRRRLTVEQKEVIKKAIAPFPGQKVTVFYPLNDAEASQYAGDFAAIFRDAGWECGDIRGGFFPTDFENVCVALSKKAIVPIDLPKGHYPLVKVMMDLGLTDNRGLDPLTNANTIDDVDEGDIGVRISAKLPPIEAATDSPPTTDP